MQEERHQRGFEFLRMNCREAKPRTRGVTEIRGPYYTAFGKRHLEDLFETMGPYIDALKFAGGSFALMPRPRSPQLSTFAIATTCWFQPGGFIEYILRQGPEAVASYIH